MMDDNDWRLRLTPKDRQEVVNKLLADLMNSDLDTINRLTNLAVEFEDKMFRSATTEAVYIDETCKRLASIDNIARSIASSSNPVGSSAPTELTNMVDFYDTAYQELQLTREKCLPELEIIHKKLFNMCQLAPRSDPLFKKHWKRVGNRIKLLKCTRIEFYQELAAISSEDISASQ